MVAFFSGAEFVRSHELSLTLLELATSIPLANIIDFGDWKRSSE